MRLLNFVAPAEILTFQLPVGASELVFSPNTYWLVGLLLCIRSAITFP